MRTPAARTRDPRSFDDLPHVFDRYAELVGAPLMDYLRERLPVRGGRAVDLGAGTGQHAALFAEHYNEVLAVDISTPMLTLARSKRPRGNITYQHRNLLEVTPADDGRFDLVFSAYTLHHVWDLPYTLTHLATLVRPGGQVILIDNVDPRHQAPRSWYRAEARRALVQDVTHGRRPLRQAAEVYRLATHPAWLDHLTTDVFLSPEQFQATYTAVFPHAQITPMYRARALHWTNHN